MNNQQRVLQYQVAHDGTVTTNGFYRIVSEREWVELPEALHKAQTRYGQIVAAIRSGQVVAIPVPDRKRAWEKRRGVRLMAQRLQVSVQMKTVADPDAPGSFLILARLAKSADG